MSKNNEVRSTSWFVFLDGSTFEITHCVRVCASAWIFSKLFNIMYHLHFSYLLLIVDNSNEKGVDTGKEKVLTPDRYR